MIKKKIKTLDEIQNKKNLDEIERLRTLERLEHIRRLTNGVMEEIDNLRLIHQRRMERIDRGFKIFKWSLIGFLVAEFIITLLRIK